MSKRKSRISLQQYYENFAEGERLFKGHGLLEFERTKIILRRFLPRPPAKILDIGGATGVYSLWLARQGFEVHLIDQSDKLVQQARQVSRQQHEASIASCNVSDARTLDFPDDAIDVVLLFGPLYHLTERKDREQALKEAYRVLKPDGILFAAAISRFASAVAGFLSGFINDPIFAEMVRQDLKEGQHRNPTDNINYFTDAYFHRPSDLKNELEAVGFKNARVFPVEGMAVLVSNFEEIWKDGALRDYLLEMIELTEQEKEIIGISPHLIGVAFKN